MKGQLSRIENGYNYMKKLLGFTIFIGYNNLYSSSIFILMHKHRNVLTLTKIGLGRGFIRSHWTIKFFKKEYSNV